MDPETVVGRGTIGRFSVAQTSYGSVLRLVSFQGSGADIGLSGRVHLNRQHSNIESDTLNVLTKPFADPERRWEPCLAQPSSLLKSTIGLVVTTGPRINTEVRLDCNLLEFGILVQI